MLRFNDGDDVGLEQSSAALLILEEDCIFWINLFSVHTKIPTSIVCHLTLPGRFCT